GTGERGTERKLRNIERVESEDIVMHALVVPWRTRTVVTEIVAGHVLVAGEPPGVVVDPLARSARRAGTWLAARRDAARELPARDRAGGPRQVDERPMEELDARERRGTRATFLVHVVAARGHVRIVADQG